MKTTRKILVLILALTICLGMALYLASCSGGKDDETVTVTDMLGETHEVKKNPTKVACASRTTYDLLVAFGLGDCIDGVYYSLLENEWSDAFDKDADSRYSLAYEESYETYISRGVELVFSPEKYITDGLIGHGVTAVNVSLYGTPDFSGFVYYFADMVKQIWDSEEVARRVDAWKAEMASTISAIQTELAKHPDVFVVGGIYQKTLLETLTTTEPYKNLDAVKNGQYYNIPMGLTMFEQLSVFSPAFLMDQANKLYPEYFDFDVEGEIKKLAKDFFDVDLTDAEIANMLNGLSRNGESLEK